jgi:hypothetical protein
MWAGMGRKVILSILNALSEGTVLADPSDLQAFATLHSHLQDAGECAETELLKSAAYHIKSASDLIDWIILNEVPDVKAAIQGNPGLLVGGPQMRVIVQHGLMYVG